MIFHTTHFLVTDDAANRLYFIEKLCEVFYEYGRKEDILSMLVTVSKRVALEYGKLHQIPCVRSTLTRKLYFK